MLTQQRLKELLHYDPCTGIFTYAQNTQRKKSGVRAGHFNQRYWKIRLDGKHYVMHILAHLYMTGEYPDFEIDHDDRDGSNNAWRNLRKASHSENCSNRNKYKNNKSGHKGVFWMKRNQKWSAYVYKDKKRYYLGLFSELQDAISAVRTKREELHGDFCNHG